MTETAIKAKSIKGYSTYNRYNKNHSWKTNQESSSRKLTENKWKPGCPKPELGEDWDQRLVVTTLMREEEGGGIKLVQEAEKDQVSDFYWIMCVNYLHLEILPRQYDNLQG